MEKRTVTVAVEGNVGSGKTTFLEFFKKTSAAIEVLPEPIDQWRNVNGYDLYDMFYCYRLRWNMPYRAQLMVTLVNQMAQPQTLPVRLIERSLHSNQFVFSEALRKNGLISEGDFKVQEEFYDWSCGLPFMKLDRIVYLRTTPDVCAERIRKRDRKGEGWIEMDYLRQLHDLHDDWLLGRKPKRCPVPVLVIDSTDSLDKVTSTYYGRRDEIFSGIKI
uniref:DNK domain-containing protein n=1 Tax=Mesocestoides corti TaxID=53468 RepID=A0A5K3FNJ1_MESCO